MHKLPHKVADSRGDFYFPEQIINPSMDMILSERICGKAVRVLKKQIVGILFDICFPMAESMTAPTWTSNRLP